MKVNVAKLLTYLEDKKLTKEDFANKLRISVCEVEKLLRGEAVGINTARKFINKLNAKTAQDLIDWDAIGVENPLAEEKENGKDKKAFGDPEDHDDFENDLDDFYKPSDFDDFEAYEDYKYAPVRIDNDDEEYEGYDSFRDYDDYGQHEENKDADYYDEDEDDEDEQEYDD